MIAAEVVDGPGLGAVPDPFSGKSSDLMVFLPSFAVTVSSVFWFEIDFFAGFFGVVQAVVSSLEADVLVVAVIDFVSDSGMPPSTHAANFALSLAATVFFGGMESLSRLLRESFAAARALL